MDNIALKEQLSEDLQNNESLSKFNDANALGNSYIELESKLGSISEEHKTKLSELQTSLDKSVQIPGEDATDEIRNVFYDKLGRPKTPEGYSNISIEGIPEDFEQDGEIVTATKSACHKAGVSDSQYKAVMTEIAKQQLVSLDTFVKRDEAAEKEAVGILTKEWGGESEYKKRSELARRLVTHYDSEKNPIAEFLMDTRLGSYAPLVKLLGNIAVDILAEETTFTGETPARKDKGAEVELSPTTGEPVLVYDKSPELK